MDSQEKSYERTNQKRRTRSELLRAACELVERGEQPSVAEVADHAGISRATAYRYFSNVDDLVREAALDAVAREIVVEVPDSSRAPDTAEKRLEDLVRQVFAMVEANEPMFRALLASSVMGKGSEKRGGRRLAWIADALKPVEDRLPPAEFKRLTNALALTTGIETQVVLKDICGLSRKQAEETTLWTARMLLAGVLATVGGNVAGAPPDTGKD